MLLLSSPAPLHFFHRNHSPPVRLHPACSLRSERDAFTEKSGYLFDLSVGEVDSLSEYDVGRIAAIYRRRPLVLLRRLLQVGSTLGRWFAARYLDGLQNKSDQMFQIRAAELREILLELGPAYVKIAQAVSSRSDLIPPSYLDQLSLLQDRIAPFSSEAAFNTIEEELQSPIEEIFKEISLEPVAAASLGQVYKARLRSNGRVVAIKVQRPGVQAAISLDILIMRYLAGLVRKAGKLNTDLQAIVDEWASSLVREMDYRREANNGFKFKNLYGGIQDVVVPEMFMEYTTRKVIVMEWIEGEKLAEVNDLYLVEVGVYCSFNQLLECGFYHADPHPGNLFRTYDGKLAYLDFGMMGEFKQELRDGFIEACLHLVNGDFDSLAGDFVTLGFLPSTANKDAVQSALTGVFQNAIAKGIQNISFGDLLGNLGTTMYKFKFQLPSYFSLVVRSLAVLEGIAVSINPNYKVLGSTYPWIARKILTDSSPKLTSSLRSLLYKDGAFRIDRLESLLSESLRARTEKNIVKRQTDDTDAKVALKQILLFTLTEKGAFVRDIVLEELAKGLDAFGLASVNSFASAATASLPFAIPSSSPLLTEEDLTNLQILRRLMLLLSGLQNRSSSGEVKGVVEFKNGNAYAEEMLFFFNQLPSIPEILPMLSVISELPPDIQQQLIRLPADLAGRVVSRAAARTLRRVLL